MQINNKLKALSSGWGYGAGGGDLLVGGKMPALGRGRVGGIIARTGCKGGFQILCVLFQRKQ